MEKLRDKVTYAEKRIDGKYPNIEKFVNCLVEIEKNTSGQTERGLMLPVCRGPDWYGNAKDFAVLKCVDKVVDGEKYTMIEVNCIKSIKIDRELEKEFLQSTPERQNEMLKVGEGRPTTNMLEHAWLYREKK